MSYLLIFSQANKDEIVYQAYHLHGKILHVPAPFTPAHLTVYPVISKDPLQVMIFHSYYQMQEFGLPGKIGNKETGLSGTPVAIVEPEILVGEDPILVLPGRKVGELGAVEFYLIDGTEGV